MWQVELVHLEIRVQFGKEQALEQRIYFKNAVHDYLGTCYFKYQFDKKKYKDFTKHLEKP